MLSVSDTVCCHLSVSGGRECVVSVSGGSVSGGRECEWRP